MLSVEEHRIRIEAIPRGVVDCIGAVSYTHLDVYKRQDMVYVEVPDKPPYKIAFVVYILPLLLILGLCVLFGTVFGVGTVWLGFVIGIAVWYAAMRAMNRKAAQRKTDGVIVRRMTDSVR